MIDCLNTSSHGVDVSPALGMECALGTCVKKFGDLPNFDDALMCSVIPPVYMLAVAHMPRYPSDFLVGKVQGLSIV